MGLRGVWWGLALVAAFSGGCGDGGGPTAPEAIEFPQDLTSTWTEMRDCRHSHEHELRYIRVFASPSAEVPYASLDPATPYPVGALLVKAEYDDAECASPIGYTFMQKLEEGASEAGQDWLWQRQDMDRNVLESGAPPRCVTCHKHHCAPPNGYDLSCAEEL